MVTIASINVRLFLLCECFFYYLTESKFVGTETSLRNLELN